MLTEAGLGFGGVVGVEGGWVVSGWGGGGALCQHGFKGEQSLQQPRALGTQSSPQSPGTHKWHRGPGDNRP